MSSFKTRSNNRLITSKHYASIIAKYNELYAKQGKVNRSKFYRDFVQPLIPSVSRRSWLLHVSKFHLQAGLQAAHSLEILDQTKVIKEMKRDTRQDTNNQENILLLNLQSAEVATRQGIAGALNIGMEALNEILDHPESLSPKDRADLLFKAMKAQDSRIKAVAILSQEGREQAKFQKAFDDAAYTPTENQ